MYDGCMTYYFDRDGQPITWEDWMALRKDKSYRILCETEIETEGVRVRTQWEGRSQEDIPLDIFKTHVSLDEATLAEFKMIAYWIKGFSFSVQDNAAYMHNEMVRSIYRGSVRKLIDEALATLRRRRMLGTEEEL